VTNSELPRIESEQTERVADRNSGSRQSKELDCAKKT
jgi:hypothetical protein